jgi:hypothetical protein
VDFILRGQLYSITNLRQQLDQAFLQLYGAFESGPALDLQSFTDAVSDFLDAFPRAFSLHDEYFSNFTIIWQRLFQARQFDRADSIWNLALQPITDWERQHPTERVHKGTPFYFLGMTAILAGDIDRGYAWMHKALDEDAKTCGPVRVYTPAFNFVTMNADADQAFQQWVTDQTRFLDHHLTNYRTASGGP